MMDELAEFTTDPETCPYLHDRPAQMNYRVVWSLSAEEYTQSLAAGWRRFGHALFRPACGECTECIPIRIPVERFRPSKSQRRTLRRNSDVEVEVGEPLLDDRRLELYREHHTEREATRGWKASGMEAEEYFEAFLSNAVRTLEFRYRIDGELVAIAYVGEASEALNSIYAFYTPRLHARGLGNFDVLAEVAEARRLGKQHLYMGFWVRGCPSMRYKSAFRPFEIWCDGAWREGDAEDTVD